MKQKLLLLLALMLGVVGNVKAQDELLIDFPNSKDGTAIGGTTVETTIKVGSNTLACYQLKNGYNSSGVSNGNNIKLTVAGGFKAGDVITVAGCINSGDVNKRGTAVVFTIGSEDKVTKLHQFEDFVDLKKETVTSLEEQTYTLEADYDGDLYLGRDGGTGTNVTVIKVSRASTKTAVTLSFPASSYTADVADGADSFTAPTATADPAAAAREIVYSSSNTNVATVDAATGAVTLVGSGSTTITAAIAGSETYQNAEASYTLTVANSAATTATVGYTEAIDGTTLKARELTGTTNVSISGPTFGSNITNYAGTSKSVTIDGTAYANTDSWRKNVKDTYEGQFVGYTLSVAPGFKMNVSHVDAKLAVADDTYKWYVEILNGAGEQIWKSGEKTTTKASGGSVDADVTDKADLRGLTGDITVNLYVKQNGSTKYFSINYLQLEVETEVDDRPTYTMTVTQNIEEAGTVTPANGSAVTEGEAVAFTATPKDGYKFVKWIIDGNDVTENPYTIENVDAAHTAEAIFAQRYKVTYDISEYIGTIDKSKILSYIDAARGIDEVYSDDDDNYTIPTYAHKYLYNEGYVFDKWVDANGNSYNSGDVLALTDNITLTPTFTATTQTLEQAGEETVVTWSLAVADMFFKDWQSSDKFGYYTQTATVNGEEIAVPMQITGGKVGNWSRSDNLAQTNSGTTFTIPAIKGMVVEIANAYVEISQTTIAGSTDYEGTGTKSISYTYTGTDKTIDIVVGESNQYLSSIKVTYPAGVQPFELTLNKYGMATYYNSTTAYTIPEGITASVVESISGTKINLVALEGTIPADCGVILEGTANQTYTFNPSSEPGTKVENMLRGSDTEATTEGDDPDATYKFYALSAKGGVLGFYWMSDQGAAFTNGANKAYLPVEQTVAGNSNALFFDTADGIQTVKGVEAAEGPAYNLSGQRVGASYKGVVIVNGTKSVRR